MRISIRYCLQKTCIFMRLVRVVVSITFECIIDMADLYFPVEHWRMTYGCCLNHLKKSGRLVMGGGRDRLVVEPDRGTCEEGGGSAPLHPRSMHHSLSQEGPRQPAPALSLPHS